MPNFRRLADLFFAYPHPGYVPPQDFSEEANAEVEVDSFVVETRDALLQTLDMHKSYLEQMQMDHADLVERMRQSTTVINALEKSLVDLNDDIAKNPPQVSGVSDSLDDVITTAEFAELLAYTDTPRESTSRGVSEKPESIPII